MFTRSPVNPTWALSPIKDLLHDGQVGPGELGLEFELEGTGLTTVAMEFNGKPNSPWKAKEDGSLMDGQGMEFVLTKPLNRSLAFEAIEELYDKLGKMASLNLSRRCSTHVHMNARPLRVSQLFLFFVVYYSLEEALFKALAPSRFYNNYCLPIVLSDSILEDVKSWATNQKIHGQISTKYRALNFNTLFTFGSLENRMMGGCTNPVDITKWLNVLLELYDYVLNNPNLPPDKFLEQYSGKGFQTFIKYEFPKVWDFIKDVPHLHKILDRGVFVAQDIAYAIDWTPMIGATPPSLVRKASPLKQKVVSPTLGWGTGLNQVIQPYGVAQG